MAPFSPSDWTPPREIETLDLGKDQWTVNWGRPGVPFGGPRFDESQVLSAMAGNDHFYKYVYEEGVSYRSWIRYWPNWGAGTWILENDVQRERFDETLTQFEEDLARYAGGGFTEQEFADAVQRLVNGSVLGAQDNAVMAWQLAQAVGNGADPTLVTRAVDRYRGVDYADVTALAAEVFAPEGVYRLVQK
jgi:predicted Zn-dependent peptidase